MRSENINLIKRIGLIALGVLILIYIIFQIFYGKIMGIQTETVTETTSYDTYETTGFVVRDETMVDSNLGGYAIYTVDDGYAIASGGNVAEIYESQEDVKAEQQIQSLQAQKSDLEELETGSSTFERDLDKLNTQIYSDIATIESTATGGTLYKTSSDIDNVTYMLNERQLVKGNTIDFASKINDINSQINELQSTHGTSIGTVPSPVAGYFISSPDGYENAINFKDVASTTVDDINNIQQQPVSDDSIGKIVTNFDWYVICKIPTDKIPLYRVGDAITIEMPYSSNMSIPATVISVNQQDNENQAALVLQCDYMNSDLAKARNEQVEINSNEYTGLKINKDAIHVNEITKETTEANGQVVEETKQVPGVYVLYGNQLEFKQIVPLYAYSSYVICDESPDEESLYTDGTVEVYDKVVTGGNNLYDGKFVS